MATIASRRLSKIVVVSFCTLVIAALVERSDEVLSKQSVAECVGKCSPIQLKSLTRKVTKLRSSCYRQCLRTSTAAYRQALVRTRISQERIRRKALPPVPDCPPSSPNQTVDWTPSKINVTFGQFENTSNWYVNISWTPLNDPNGSWTEILVRFSTTKNGPDFGRQQVVCLEYPKNQTFATLAISSHGYQYPNSISLYINGLPYSEGKVSGVNMNSYKPLTESSHTVTTEVQTTGATKARTSGQTVVTTSVSVSLGILVGIALVACVLKYIFYRKKSSKLPSEFKYHAFIIYSSADESWVTGELLPFLEEERHLKCCVHYRNFTPGLPYEDNMAESVYNSYKVIAVFSTNFLQSNYCSHELDLAKYRLLKERDGCLVIIRIDKTDCNKLPRGLKKRSFIDYASILERPFWKSKLIKFLDIPSDCDNEYTSVEQDNDNNNSAPRDSSEGNKQQTNAFNRLNSTNSTATEISIVTIPDLDETFL